MLALGKMYFQGIRAVAKGGWRCWYWLKCVSRAWGQFKSGFLFDQFSPRLLYHTTLVGQWVSVADALFYVSKTFEK